MAHSVSSREERRVHQASPKRYYVVWVALLVFTAITVVTGRVHLPGHWAILVALLIALTKASLVALFFMHLWDHGGANRLVLVTSVLFVLLMLGITVLDNASRFPLTNPPTTDTLRWQPPGPDILSPGASGRSSEHQGPRDRAPQEQR